VLLKYPESIFRRVVTWKQMAHCCKLCIVLKVADIVFLLMLMLILPLEEKEVFPWYLRHDEKYGPIQSTRSCTYLTYRRGTAGSEPNASQSGVEGDHTPDAATPGTIKRF
jgi:hypothetical protein